jgi:hypothetical protein
MGIHTQFQEAAIKKVSLGRKPGRRRGIIIE